MQLAHNMGARVHCHAISGLLRHSCSVGRRRGQASTPRLRRHAWDARVRMALAVARPSTASSRPAPPLPAPALCLAWEACFRVRVVRTMHGAFRCWRVGGPGVPRDAAARAATGPPRRPARPPPLDDSSLRSCLLWAHIDIRNRMSRTLWTRVRGDHQRPSGSGPGVRVWSG